MRRPDVAALVFGLLLIAVAATALWADLVGPVDWQALKVVAPLSLVAIGIAGLAVSRRGS